MPRRGGHEDAGALGPRWCSTERGLVTGCDAASGGKRSAAGKRSSGGERGSELGRGGEEAATALSAMRMDREVEELTKGRKEISTD